MDKILPMPGFPEDRSNVPAPDRVTHWLQIADRALGKPRYWPEGVLFIKTELETGLAFSKIALDSSNVEKIARNTANARVAYEAALRFVRNVLLTPEDAFEIDQEFGELKGVLLRLGERL